MQDDYWDKLINKHLDNSLSKEEHSDFELLMLQSESARKRFWELSEVHGIAQDASFNIWGDDPNNGDELYSIPSSIEDEVKSIQPESIISTKTFWAKSAVMLVFGALAGVLSTSFIWAMSSPEENAPLILLSESFETDEQPKVTGVPNQVNIWSGDLTQLSSGRENIEPTSGNRMLQFMSADYQGKPNTGGYIADVYRLLDLRDYEHQFSKSQSVIQISANFNSYQYPKDQEFLYSISLYALDNESLVSESFSNNINLQDISLATSQRSREILDRDPKTWQQGIVELRVPPETEYVLVRLAVAHSRKKKASEKHLFNGHFLDLVNVLLIESPLQNLRVGE